MDPYISIFQLSQPLNVFALLKEVCFSHVVLLFQPCNGVFVNIPGDALPGMDDNSDMDADLVFQKVPVLQQNLGRMQQQQQACGLQPPSSPYDEAELDALAEIERIEREAASEKCSKEVQDKGMWYNIHMTV